MTNLTNQKTLAGGCTDHLSSFLGDRVFSAAVTYLQFPVSGLLSRHGAVTDFPNLVFIFRTVDCIEL